MTTPAQLRRRVERDRRARRAAHAMKRRPDSVRTSILAATVAMDRLHASIEHVTRSAVRATIAMSKMEETR